MEESMPQKRNYTEGLMKNLSSLDEWLKVPTWESLHPKDDERFYQAIYAMIKSNDDLVESIEVKYYILKFFGKTDADAYWQERASLFANRYEVIYSFFSENNITL